MAICIAYLCRVIQCQLSERLILYHFRKTKIILDTDQYIFNVNMDGFSTEVQV